MKEVIKVETIFINILLDDNDIKIVNDMPLLEL